MRRPFDCGKHACQKSCHTPSLVPARCPFSPSITTHCPCTKHALVAPSIEFFPPTPNLILPRTQCTDPIPTCRSTCLKTLPNCPHGHVCSDQCHKGECGRCKTILVRPCRCGSAVKDVVCSDLTGEDDVRCDRTCGALLGCGKHRCTRICCPLAGYGQRQGGGGGGKKKRNAALGEVDDADEGGLHGCELECGKILACGTHHCERKDHRGACGPCLASSFEEVCFVFHRYSKRSNNWNQMICHCGRTVLEPPIQCGTIMQCPFPCSRTPPECGHPSVPHSCHDSGRCPPCAVLTGKRCACGKKVVGNVRCSQERVGCGAVCGKLMGCGYHTCQKLCHGDECGPCTATCGKPRKEW